MAKQLLGKEVTAALNERIKADVAALKEKGVNPTLGIIRVGERPDDLSYERGATKRCETLGVEFKKYLLPAEVTQEELLKVIEEVNNDDNIHGVLMFRPLPKHIDQSVVENALSAEKDVDCQTDADSLRLSLRTMLLLPAYLPASRSASRPVRPRLVWRFLTITELTAPARRP